MWVYFLDVHRSHGPRITSTGLGGEGREGGAADFAEQGESAGRETGGETFAVRGEGLCEDFGRGFNFFTASGGRLVGSASGRLKVRGLRRLGDLSDRTRACFFAVERR